MNASAKALEVFEKRFFVYKEFCNKRFIIIILRVIIIRESQG